MCLKLTTDSIGWSMLNDTCGEKSEEVSETYRRLERFTGKTGVFTYHRNTEW